MKNFFENSLILGLILSIVLILIPHDSFALADEGTQVVISDGGTGSGWLWKSETVRCTVTKTIGVDFGVVGTYSETYEGTKTVCRDGWNLCWSGFCK